MVPKPGSARDASASVASDFISNINGDRVHEITSVKLVNLPARKCVGRAGEVILLQTTHFPIDISRLGNIYVYNVQVKFNYKFRNAKQK
jgi:hypothetical protein